jgi:cell division transport system permease protein
MSSNLSQKSPRKSKPTFIYAILSIAMILFLVGLLGSGYFFANKMMNNLKESVEVEVELTDSITPIQLSNVRKFLQQKPYIKDMKYKSKIEAAKSFQKELGQDFVEILRTNPLYDSYILHLKASYSDKEKIEIIKSSIEKIKGVASFNYSPMVLDVLSANIQKIMYVLSILAGILLLIAFSLIDNTIRLSMFSQRFLIRSMQLIGATKWFILKPYIIRSIFTGILSALIAIMFLAALMYYIQYRIQDLSILDSDLIILSAIAIIIIICGIFISAISTYFSVNKYLHIKLDELY